MDISKADFPLELLKILEEVSDSHFVAFDLEFSGVASRRPGGTQKLSLQEYYDDIKAAAGKYQILQAGFTIVKQDLEKNRYEARPYNFNLSPLPSLRERHFTPVSFLARNGFSFDRPISSGVQYLSRSEEHLARRNMISDEESRNKIGDMDLKPEDDALIQHIRSELRSWQAQGKKSQDGFVNIPAESPGTVGIPAKLNRYQVRLTHQIVRNEYPGLKTVGMGHFVQVTNPTKEQQASQKLAAVETRENEIAKAIGFRWLIEGIVGGSILGLPAEYVVAGLPRVKLKGQSPEEYLHKLQERLRSRPRVLVGHNCLTDFVNLYSCFFGPLPATIEGFASTIHDLFPGVIDTKVLASFSAKSWANTSLEDVELDLKRQETPKIHVPAAYDRYAYTSKYHEAGYDSLLTATVAIKLSTKLKSEDQYTTKLKSEDQYTNQAEKNGSQRRTHGFGDNEDEFYDARQCGGEDDEDDLVLEQAEHHTVVAPVKENTSSTLLAEPKPKSKPEAASLPSRQDNVTHTKSKLATPNIYELLSTDEDEAVESDQTGPSLTDEKAVDMMPAWDEDRFWSVFGNKLQVNGSKEGMCKLE
ncbi:hypothetical protein DV735_g2877, partial [Chaetothyriales sp. CBS 134920]